MKITILNGRLSLTIQRRSRLETIVNQLAESYDIETRAALAKTKPAIKVAYAGYFDTLTVEQHAERAHKALYAATHHLEQIERHHRQAS